MIWGGWGLSGADPGFQVRGAHFKKLRRAEGGAKIVGVFRVKNHDFTPKKSYFFPILGRGVPGAPSPLCPPLEPSYIYSQTCIKRSSLGQRKSVF